MLTFLYDLLVDTLHNCGFEIAAQLLKNLALPSQDSVSALLGDTLLLIVTVHIIEKCFRALSENKPIYVAVLLLFITTVSSMVYLWIKGGADPAMKVDALLQAARGYVLLPSFVLFVAAPYFLILFGLRDIFINSGGAALGIRKQVYVILGVWFSILIVMPRELPIEQRLLFALFPSAFISLCILIFMARRRRDEVNPYHSWKVLRGPRNPWGPDFHFISLKEARAIVLAPFSVWGRKTKNSKAK